MARRKQTPPAVWERWSANSDPVRFGELTAREFNYHFSDEAAAIRREISWTGGVSERDVYDEQHTQDYLTALRAAKADDSQEDE